MKYIYFGVLLLLTILGFKTLSLVFTEKVYITPIEGFIYITLLLALSALLLFQPLKEGKSLIDKVFFSLEEKLSQKTKDTITKTIRVIFTIVFYGGIIALLLSLFY